TVVSSCRCSSRGRRKFFFFSSRRRHTRFSRDWSSDVCSSDLTCRRLGEGQLCQRCRADLWPAPEQYLPELGVISPAYRHRGTARALVHHLKYRGVAAAADVLAEELAGSVRSDVVLVPVPRVGWRRLRYGVDPALELAVSLDRLTGGPLVRALWAPPWGRRRAGRSHGFPHVSSPPTGGGPGGARRRRRH